MKGVWWQVNLRPGRHCLDQVPLDDGMAEDPDRPDTEVYSDGDMRRLRPVQEEDRKWRYSGHIYRLGVMGLRFHDRTEASARSAAHYSTSNGTLTVVLSSPFHFEGQYLRLSSYAADGVRSRRLSWWRLPDEYAEGPGPRPPLETTHP